MLGGYHRAEKCGEEIFIWGKLLRAAFASFLVLIIMLGGLRVRLRVVLLVSVSDWMGFGRGWEQVSTEIYDGIAFLGLSE